ncbi:hypothetical protein LJ740_07310 [Planctobacterium marinum]|nr:hypothetical protein [Planctobacterium marinum]
MPEWATKLSWLQAGRVEQGHSDTPEFIILYSHDEHRACCVTPGDV